MKISFKKLLALTATFLLLSACSSGTDTKETKEKKDSLKVTETSIQKTKPHFPTGEIIDTLACQNDHSLHYALYLPSDYTTDKKWPVIYCFDPHGKGKLPLTKYHELAEKYHFILIGFYDSKNGENFNVINQNVQKLLNDTYQSLSLDPERIYTCGFSGGSKVAGLIAVYDGNITGVIACGAGLPQIKQALQSQFDYIALCGNADFHYNELISQNENLERIHFRHQFLSFDGKHEWPPSETMQQAFTWIQLNAMKSHLIPENDSLIKAVKSGFEKKIAEYQRKKDTYQLYLTAQTMCNYLNGLSKLKECEQLDSLSQTKAVTDQEKDNSSLAVKEMGMQKKYMQKIVRQNDGWWKNEVRHLNAMSKQSTDEALMYRRVLSYLSLVSYMQADNALKQHNTTNAAHFINIFTMVDPDNPDHYYLSAWLNAQAGKKELALKDLKQAIKLGFSDYQRLEENIDFTSIRNDPGYKEILKGMH